jgi:hypothetical protein
MGVDRKNNLKIDVKNECCVGDRFMTAVALGTNESVSVVMDLQIL